MHTTIVLDSEVKIDNKKIIEIARKLKKLFDENILGKEIAVYKLVKGRHTYIFKFGRESFTDKEVEVIISVFYHAIETDFEIEFETEVPDPEGLEEGSELEVYSESAKHEMWVGERLKAGWRYGMEFNESDKTDPLMRPYYLLSESQRKKLV